MTNPEIILLAIRSAIKLSRQLRNAYVDNMKRRELMLPLPGFPNKPDWVSALHYFEDEGSHYVDEDKRIAELLEMARHQKLDDEEKDEFSLFHQERKALDMAKEGRFLGEGMSAEAIAYLCSIRQWRRGTAQAGRRLLP